MAPQRHLRHLSLQVLLQLRLVVQSVHQAAAVRVPSQQLNCTAVVDPNKTCLLNASISTPGGLYLNWPGSILLSKQPITAGAGIQMLAGGTMSMVEGASLVGQQGNVCITAAAIHLKDQSNITAQTFVCLSTTGGPISVDSGSTVRSRQDDIEATSSGNITVGGKASILAEGTIRLFAGSVSKRIRYKTEEGMMSIDGKAKITANGDVRLRGSGVTVLGSASVEATGLVVIRGPERDLQVKPVENDACTLGIHILGDGSIDGTRVQGRSVIMMCNSSGIEVTHAAKLVTWWDTGFISMEADHIALTGCNTNISTANLSLTAVGDVNISAALLGVHPEAEYGTSILASVQVATWGSLEMGSCSGYWNLRSFRAIAGSASVIDQTLRTQGNSCRNRAASKVDVCQQILEGWPISPSDPTTQTTSNLSFDCVVAARRSLNVTRANFYAASLLLCSGEEASLQGPLSFDSSGRGCPPGEGKGAGINCGAWYMHCGTGGGSHFGSGGRGARYLPGAPAVEQCAFPGQTYDRQSDLLPTEGASGGGCGVPSPCPTDEWFRGDGGLPSSGGGLIWVSARRLAARGTVMMIASGNQGKVIPLPDGAREQNASSDTRVSGGGAGGSILIFTGAFFFLPNRPTDNLLTLDVSGGRVQCGELSVGSMVSGAGGGGIIGFNWTGYASGFVGGGQIMPLVGGGEMPLSCQAYLPRKDIGVTFGDAGLATSLAPCPAGYTGMFCEPCPRGTWAPSGLHSSCVPCTNAPSRLAKYNQSAWYNADCPYVCKSGFPSRTTNPRCKSTAVFVFDLFGGKWGSLCLLAMLMLVSGFLLWRHAKQKHVRRRTQAVAAAVGDGCGPREASKWCCRRRAGRMCCCWQLASEPEPQGDREQLHFRREHLPYHVCRIYLQGQNRRDSTWNLGGVPSPAIEPLVLPAEWSRLAVELHAMAAVPKSEARCEALLTAVYPPLAPLYARCRRRRRARRLKELAFRFSGGGGGGGHGDSLWRPMRARSEGGGGLGMTFGCDRRATLGYLDFFDFARSQLDWAPTVHPREARLFLAKGNGSYDEPFALDMADPLVQNVTLVGETAAVHHIMARFNQMSRLMPPLHELRKQQGTDMFAGLKDRVLQCGEQHGLAGMVQVLLLAQPIFPVPSSEEPSLLPPGAVGAQATRSELEPAFSDLIAGVHTPNGEATLLPRAGNDNVVERVLVGADLKLCLAFLDTSSPCEPSRAPCADGMALTSPMLKATLSEHSAWASLPSPGSSPEAACSGRWRRFLTRFESWWVEQRSRGAGSRSPASVLLAAVVLTVADIMAFVIMAATFLLLEGGREAAVVGLLLPPLTLPLAAVLGPAFLLTESPTLGRSFAALSLLGAVNVTAATVVYAAQSLVARRDASFFYCGQLAAIYAIKVLLFSVINVHIGNLEVAHDVRFFESCQTEVLGAMLEETTSGRQPTPVLPLASDRLGLGLGLAGGGLGDSPPALRPASSPTQGPAALGQVPTSGVTAPSSKSSACAPQSGASAGAPF